MGISYLSKLNEEKANELLSKLTTVNNNLENIIKEVAYTQETSNIYWSSIQVKISREYENARIIVSEWANNNVPDVYNRQIRQEIARLNKLKYNPLRKVSSKTLVNTNASKQTIQALIQEIESSIATGLLSGKNTMFRLCRLTQQINVFDSNLNKAVEEGFEQAGNIYGSQKATRNELLKKSLDGKYITVVNKNGKPTQWGINTYSDLVARTKLQDTLSDAVVNTALAVGSDLIQVSSHNTTTEICQQYEGKIFSLSGKDKDFPVADNIPAYHPNCKHSITIVIKEGLEVSGTLDKYIDFSNGKTGVHPTRQSFIPVKDR